MTTWIVRQTWPTLGDSCERSFDNLVQARAYAGELRGKIAAMVVKWVPGHGRGASDHLPSAERLWWAYVQDMVSPDGPGTYSREAAEIIADMAVKVVGSGWVEPAAITGGPEPA